MKLFCKHDKELIKILYGDTVNYFHNKRWILKCKKCRKIFFQ